MSDKSFGDHINRNIVKNPLLLSAVTGVSLEDLTHKAVLLPATPTQGQVPQLDQAEGSQARTLAHDDHNKPSFPSGDAFSNISIVNTTFNTNTNILDSKSNDKTRGTPIATQSKASLKSEDDFDVNEYIARLQGTRYVSAPLHSHIKDDQNANLEAEESLEEINLNEQNETVEVQQSLTADIAQNFSQLPAVLPHVASAVFSSFSNMLSMKSREQTPDDAKVATGYQEVQFGNPDVGVPLMGVEESTPKDFGLPPKEPPIMGISSYRITSKKKYAQIPGLSSGDNAQNLPYNAPIKQSVPPFFNPAETIHVSATSEARVNEAMSQLFPPCHALDHNNLLNAEASVDATNTTNTQVMDKTYDIFNPSNQIISSGLLPTIPATTSSDTSTASSSKNLDYIRSDHSVSNTESQIHFFTPIEQRDVAAQPGQPPSIIPPPAMFSSIKKDSQTSVAKSVLPPSVARRISANQPLIKPQIPIQTFTENIFIPSAIPDNIDQTTISSELPPMPTSIAYFDKTVPSLPPPQQTIPASVFSNVNPVNFFSPPAELTQTSVIGGPFSTTPNNENSQEIGASVFTQNNTTAEISGVPNFPPLPTSTTLPIPSSTSGSFGPKIGSLPPASNIELAFPSSTALPFQLSTTVASANTPSQSYETMLHSVPQMGKPPVQSPQDIPHPITQYPPDFTPEPAKPVVEPPKASGNVNFRMTKKRPQYYSGPIEGVGDISNNVKPMIAPAIPPVPSLDANFQGSFFTPAQLQSQAVDQYAAPYEQGLMPFDISRPVEPVVQPFSPFHTSKPQSYGQDYNTAFDLSRSTTEAFESPKQENKGFGIIGSLKSKLSSIDINKIQSTVTTFFDPAYNEAKVDAPYAPQQYGQYSHDERNFEITVPNIEQNQFGYQHGYSDPNQYYQAPNTYKQNVENQEQLEFGFQHYLNPPLNINAQKHTVSTNYTQENIPQTEDDKNYNVNIDGSATIYQHRPDIAKFPQTVEKPNEEANLNVFNYAASANVPHGVIGDVAHKTVINPHTGIQKDLKKFINPVSKAATFFDSPLVGAEIKTHNNFSLNESQTDMLQNHPFGQKVTPATSFFDHPMVGIETNELADKMAQLALAEEIAIRNTPFQAVDLQMGVRAEPNVETSSILKVVGIKPVATTSQDMTIPDLSVYKEKRSSLLESLSKKDLPIVEVSKAPLFGISAILTDESPERTDVTDIKSLTFNDHQVSKPHLEKQTSFGFFEDTLPEVKLRDNPVKTAVGLSITDVKNVLLIEPPQENLGTLLKRNASSSLLKDLPETEAKSQNLSQDRDSSWNLDTSIFTSNENVNVSFNRRASGFFDHLLPSENIEEKGTETVEHASDFNICETCREVNVPEDKETENVTRQMIENINSSIQLSNPVEAVFTESNESNNDTEFDNTRLDDITQITEDTYEFLQVKSATELLDDANASRANSYGWNTEQLAYASVAAIDEDFGQNVGATNSNDFSFITGEKYNTAADTEYTFKIDPNAIGLFGDNSLFFDNVPNNASDEIKAELKTSHDDIAVLPRQMSLPSAPPAEDDSKSDETGVLDVHSIEQDAKKDFPLEEEFIIEPSETDDDKIEFRELKRSSEDSVNDTFAGRIEKFKSKVGADSNDDIFDQKTGQEDAIQSQESNYDVQALPPKSMASYFDTGNYAVETHYRNSLTSPTNIPTFQDDATEPVFRIPPGFEDQFNRRQSRGGMSSFADQDPCIPDTSTQTRTTLTPTFSTSVDVNKVSPREPIAEHNFPAEPNERKSVFGPAEPNTNEFKNILQDDTAVPDPMNFFASNTEEPKTTTEAPQDFSRLASYFSMAPPQPDHSKSFFELSQSQNHYRHGLPKPDWTPKPNNELLRQGHIDNKTIENLQNLMEDLTSPQNINFDTIVRTVNYFAVEHNLDTGNTKVEKCAFANIKNIDNLDSINKHINGLDSSNIKDADCMNVIDSCEHCNKLDGNYKVKTAMNNSDKDSGNKNMNEMDPNTSQRSSVAVDIGTLAMDDEAQERLTEVHECRSSSEYTPVRHHWFYRVDVEDKSVWRGFSMTDSTALEQAYHSPDLNEDTLVPTDGGRFDVNVVGRLRIAVYWKEKPTNVRRCSWFYKGTTDARYVPYTEAVADKLEEEYRHGVTTGEWHRRLVLPNSELVVMHGPAVMVHFLHGGVSDSFNSPPFLFGKRVYRNPPVIRVVRDQPRNIDHLILFVHGAGEYKRTSNPSTSRPRVVRRGCEESEIEDSEPSSIDHLLLLCHGVGSACDMRFRSVEEVVEDFRATSLQLLQSHYRNSYDNGIVSRIEVLPISWHEQLHAGEGGVDKRLNKVTLESIPRLRAFTNHTVLDVLFYTSPVYHQTIVDTVAFELNRVYSLFKLRNPNFKGDVSLGGHSLGSVILYDLLCHQTPETPLTHNPSAEKAYLSSAAKNLTPLENYPQLGFPPAALYALGSPIAIFECIRGVESLGLEFALPTCRHFFNIFHPYDPIAYRIEPLINPLLQDAKPYLIPHHKGRKRMHLELKDTMVRVGADLKQKLIESLRTTWNKWKSSPPPEGQLEKVVEEEMEKEQLCDEAKEEQLNAELTTPEMLGRLNCGRRVDYVLQEAPLEMINEYLFAMSSHVGYWESEDTMLLMLREIYSSLGVQPDCTVPQQSMTVTRTRQDDVTEIIEKENPSTSRGS